MSSQKKSDSLLTADRLREALSYDPLTGIFRWRVKRGPHGPGAIAGCIHKRWNRRVIRLDGPLYFASRLAWLYMTGGWPINEVDHRNTDSTDDRWDNLRDVTPSQNRHNQVRGRGASQTLGVGYRKDKNKWRAYITIDGRLAHLGYFETREAAEAAYIDAKRKHHHPGQLTDPR